MAEESLVEDEIQGGERLLRALDAAGVPVIGAFWFYHTDSERWKLMIFTPEARKGARDLYVKAIGLDAGLDLAKVEFLSPDSPLFTSLGALIRVDGVSNVRMSQNMLNGVYVHDAYIYRLAA